MGKVLFTYPAEIVISFSESLSMMIRPFAADLVLPS